MHPVTTNPRSQQQVPASALLFWSEQSELTSRDSLAVPRSPSSCSLSLSLRPRSLHKATSQILPQTIADRDPMVQTSTARLANPKAACQPTILSPAVRRGGRRRDPAALRRKARRTWSGTTHLFLPERYGRRESVGASGWSRPAYERWSLEAAWLIVGSVGAVRCATAGFLQVISGPPAGATARSSDGILPTGPPDAPRLILAPPAPERVVVGAALVLGRGAFNTRPLRHPYARLRRVAWSCSPEAEIRRGASLVAVTTASPSADPTRRQRKIPSQGQTRADLHAARRLLSSEQGGGSHPMSDGKATQHPSPPLAPLVYLCCRQLLPLLNEDSPGIGQACKVHGRRGGRSSSCTDSDVDSHVAALAIISALAFRTRAMRCAIHAAADSQWNSSARNRASGPLDPVISSGADWPSHRFPIANLDVQIQSGLVLCSSSHNKASRKCCDTLSAWRKSILRLPLPRPRNSTGEELGAAMSISNTIKLRAPKATQHTKLITDA